VKASLRNSSAFAESETGLRQAEAMIRVFIRLPRTVRRMLLAGRLALPLFTALDRLFDAQTTLAVHQGMFFGTAPKPPLHCSAVGAKIAPLKSDHHYAIAG
jgi:hypothetical protein